VWSSGGRFATGTSGEGVARCRVATSGDSLVCLHPDAVNRADEGGSSFGSDGGDSVMCVAWLKLAGPTAAYPLGQSTTVAAVGTDSPRVGEEEPCCSVSAASTTAAGTEATTMRRGGGAAPLGLLHYAGEAQRSTMDVEGGRKVTGEGEERGGRRGSCEWGSCWEDGGGGEIFLGLRGGRSQNHFEYAYEDNTPLATPPSDPTPPPTGYYMPSQQSGGSMMFGFSGY
jgi:hypothetical protein